VSLECASQHGQELPAVQSHGIPQSMRSHFIVVAQDFFPQMFLRPIGASSWSPSMKQ
jgi:hypothetical protein